MPNRILVAKACQLFGTAWVERLLSMHRATVERFVEGRSSEGTILLVKGRIDRFTPYLKVLHGITLGRDLV